MANRDRKRKSQRVQILEENNTYHSMEPESDSITSETRTLLIQVEEDNNEDSLRQFEQYVNTLHEANEIAKSNEIQITKNNGMCINYIELGSTYINELITIVHKVRTIFEQISEGLQLYKDVISVDWINRQLVVQADSNVAALRLLDEPRKRNAETKSTNEQRHYKILEKYEANSNDLKELSDQIHLLNEKNKLLDNKVSQNMIIIDEEQTVTINLTAQLHILKEREAAISLDVQNAGSRKDAVTQKCVNYEREYNLQKEAVIGTNESVDASILLEAKSTDELERSLEELKSEISISFEAKNQLASDNLQLENKIAGNQHMITDFENRKLKISEESDQRVISVATPLADYKRLLEIDKILESNQERVLIDRKENESNLKQEITNISNNCAILENTKTDSDDRFNNLHIENSKLTEQVTEITQDLIKIKSNINNIEADLKTEFEIQQGEENTLSASIKDLEEKCSEEVRTSQNNFAHIMDEFKRNSSEMVDLHAVEIEKLKSATNDVQMLAEEVIGARKTIENELNCVHAECDVISRKMHMLERTNRDEQRRVARLQNEKAHQAQRVNQARYQPTTSKKREFDAASDSSIDAPHLIDIMKRQKEIKRRHEISRNKSKVKKLSS